jgi:O-acetylserine/cysteine efflux transporter
MTGISFGPGERWALVSAIAYTVVNVTLRAAAPTIDPALGSLLRLIPLAVVAWFVVLRGGAHEYRPGHPEFLGWRLIGALVVGGAISLVLGNILYFRALTEGGLGITVSGIQAGSVLGGIAIGLVVLGDRPRPAQLAGAGIIVVGLALIAAARTGELLQLWWLGLLFALGAGTTYAIANVFTGYVQRRRPLLFVSLAGSNLGGFVPLAVIVGASAATTPAGPAVDAYSAFWVMVAGCANAVALAGLAMSLRSTTIAATSTISSASIVLSFVASVVIFNESGQPLMVLGVLLVTAGIVAAQLGRRPAAGGAPTRDRAVR